MRYVFFFIDVTQRNSMSIKPVCLTQKRMNYVWGKYSDPKIIYEYTSVLYIYIYI